MQEPVDLIIRGWYLVTMNAARDVIRDGAVAVRDGTIVAVGKSVDLEREYASARTLGGERFVVTPGMVNTHIHITGEPLTRGYVPDDTPFEENVFEWLCPLYAEHDAAEERLSAQLAAVEMLRSGTTTFLEAGTIRFLDDVVEGLVEVGIRGSCRRWVWDLPPEPAVYRQYHRRADRPSRTPARRPSEPHAERRICRMVHPRRPHHMQRSAVAGSEIASRRARRRHELPHVTGAGSTRRLHRRVRTAPDDPPRRDRCARPATSR